MHELRRNKEIIMTFNQSLESDPALTVLHDPNGQEAQFHELPDGSGVITFSDEFCNQCDWQVGDEIIMDIEQANAGLSIQNKSAIQRQEAIDRFITDGGRSD
jgi:hypothetical protein